METWGSGGARPTISTSIVRPHPFEFLFVSNHLSRSLFPGLPKVLPRYPSRKIVWTKQYLRCSFSGQQFKNTNGRIKIKETEFLCLTMGRQKRKIDNLEPQIGETLFKLRYNACATLSQWFQSPEHATRNEVTTSKAAHQPT